VASREPSGVPESVVEEPERAEESRSGTGGPQEGAEKSFTEEEPESRSWWRRVFGA
jgi:hypothetical protein